MTAGDRPVLEVSEVSFGYGKARADLILEKVSFSLRAGEALALLGTSGIGKTTLAKLCAGICRPKFGEIRHQNTRIERPSSAITVSFQNYPCFPWLSVEQNVMFGLKAPKHLDGNGRAYAYWLLEKVGLYETRTKYPRELSGGMLQRLSLARCLVLHPNVLILDEPFSALDQTTKSDLIELILELQAITQFTLLIILHDLRDAYSLVDRVVVLAGRPATNVLELKVSGLDFVGFQRRVLEAMKDPRALESLETGLLGLLGCIRAREVPSRQLIAKILARPTLTAINQRISSSDIPFILDLLRERDTDRLHLGIRLATALMAEPEIYESMTTLWSRSVPALVRLDLVQGLSRAPLSLPHWLEQEAIAFVCDQWQDFINIAKHRVNGFKVNFEEATIARHNIELGEGPLAGLLRLAVACASGEDAEARNLVTELAHAGITRIESLVNIPTSRPIGTSAR
ncbi:MAG: ATP-binding cassette domain-containing protein [Acidobacteria bacterium]|nr:ATP-binding cassette domain-containing protein [Acidobacteriota bacterium]